MDSFSDIFALLPTEDLVGEFSMAPISSRTKPDSDPPVDEERYGAGNTGAFCVIA